MLIGPNRVPALDESVKVRLKFDDGTIQIIDAIVRKSAIKRHSNDYLHSSQH
jgi:copper(I)-binding protein